MYGASFLILQPLLRQLKNFSRPVLNPEILEGEYSANLAERNTKLKLEIVKKYWHATEKPMNPVRQSERKILAQSNPQPVPLLLQLYMRRRLSGLISIFAPPFIIIEDCLKGSV